MSLPPTCLGTDIIWTSLWDLEEAERIEPRRALLGGRSQRVSGIPNTPPLPWQRCCPVNHCTSFILNHCKHRQNGMLCFFPHCWPSVMFLLKTLVSVPIQSKYIGKWASVIGIIYNNCNNYLYLPSGNQCKALQQTVPESMGKGEAFILH